MAKLTTTTLTGQYASVAALNANFDLIETALENTLSRDGTTPNTMSANLDMNSKRITNLPAPTGSADAARLIDIQDAVSVAIAPSQTGNSGKFLTTDGSVASWDAISLSSLSGTLAVANGGTGATTASAARTALSVSATSEVVLKALTSAQGDIIQASAANTPARLAIGTAYQKLRVNAGATALAYATLAPTRQVFTSGTAATYTTPAGCVAINVRCIGPGGGGGAQATNNGAAGSGATTFSTMSAGAGTGGAAAGAGGGNGGSSSGGDINISGGKGSIGPTGVSTAVHTGPGGGGGNSHFGGAGVGGDNGGTGTAAATNSGSGGGGGGPTGGTASGAGGGAGGYCEKLITSPSATYTYTVGIGGAAGAAGAVAGGAGAAGIIIVDEYY